MLPFKLYTHLHPIAFFPSGKSTNSYVLFASNAAISSSMALSQNACPTTSSKQMGSTSYTTFAIFA
jgi:hypothetical protein